MLAMCAAEDAPISPDIPEEAINFRQLRHHTKNSLQRIIANIFDSSALCRSREGRQAADELVRRIELSAEISDALFGFTQTTKLLAERLQSLTDSLVALYTDGLQCIDTEILVSARMQSASRDALIVQIAHELVINALVHGMHMRLLGKLSIHVTDQTGGGILLSVINDGWRMGEQVSTGEGLSLVMALTQSEGGAVDISSAPRTEFRIRLPSERRHKNGPFNQTRI